MNECPFDESKLRRLLDGTLSPEEAEELAAHGPESCPSCAALCSTESAAATIDDWLALPPAQRGCLEPPSPSPAELRALERAILQQVRPVSRWRRLLQVLSGPPLSWRGWPAPWRNPALLGAAALIGLVIVAGVLLERPSGLPAGGAGDPEAGLKGPTSKPELALSFLVVTPGNPSAEERGRSGGHYPAGRAIVVRMVNERPAFLRLAHVSEAGEVDWLFPLQPEEASALPAGIRYLEQGGKPLAYSLSGLTGRQAFVLLGSEGPLPQPELLRRAIAGVAGPRATVRPRDLLQSRLPAGVTAELFTLVAEGHNAP